MKRCPNCEKEYADSMRFCQTDGTLLVEAAENAPPPDPYKTVVGGMIKMNDDSLQLPDPPDTMKTMISPMSAPKTEAPKAEPPKPAGEPASAPSKPENQTPPVPKFDSPNSALPVSGDSELTMINLSPNSALGSEAPKSDVPPPKPFNDIPTIDSAPPKFNSPHTSGKTAKKDSPFDKPQNAPGSSPFDKPSNAPSSKSPFEKSPPPPYKEPEQFGGQQPPPYGNSTFQQPQTPFGQSSEPMEDSFKQDSWTPPPAPVAGWQDQGLGANTPFQPPAAVGQNNTLAIVSLVLGILSFVCSLSIFASIPAIITGYMQRNNIKNNPEQYGGDGMALAGMIIGGINLALSVIVLAIWILFIFANIR